MKVDRKRVLIVDPDISSAQQLLHLFAEEDIDLEITGSVAAAAERAKNVKFDCVIMDVELPDMKGYDAVPILKTIDPKLQIIMTAAENTMELEAKVRKQDIFYYYIKSFDRQELKEAVRDALKKTAKYKEVRKMDNKKKVLVVDDDHDFVKAMTMILESEGYRVEAAYNKGEALEKIETTKPDLILLDIMMEKWDDGFTTCFKLKNDPKLQGIPILAVSAIAEKTGFQFSPITDGDYFMADDYLQKPVKPSVLLERVAKLLER